MTTHTKEPWHTGRITGDRREITSAPGEAGQCTLIADVHPILTKLGGIGDRDANARRIAACVNACAGIPTYRLEVGALAKALAVVSAHCADPWCGDANIIRKIIAEAVGRLSGMMRVQIYPIDQDTGARGPLHWEGEFNAEVIQDDEERAEVEAKLRESGVAMVGGGAMPLVLIVRVGG